MVECVCVRARVGFVCVGVHDAHAHAAYGRSCTIICVQTHIEQHNQLVVNVQSLLVRSFGTIAVVLATTWESSAARMPSSLDVPGTQCPYLDQHRCLGLWSSDVRNISSQVEATRSPRLGEKHAPLSGILYKVVTRLSSKGRFKVITK